ncbi:MAG: hypothetical protein AAFX51_05560, partial [Cyanobacteria bacterium J06636_28]
MAVLSRWDKQYWFIFLLLASAGFFIHCSFWHTPAEELQGHDMYYIWLEGKRIIAGENPYARVLAGNLRENDKYATYFPIAYLLSALVQKLGFLDYRDWLYFWRPLSFTFHMGIVGLTLKYFQRRGLLVLGAACRSSASSAHARRSDTCCRYWARPDRGPRGYLQGRRRG